MDTIHTLYLHLPSFVAGFIFAAIIAAFTYLIRKP